MVRKDMENILVVGCPVCGAVHRVVAAAGMEGKSLTCRRCGTRQPFVKYRPISQGESETSVGTSEVCSPGVLECPSLGLSFQLKAGRNVIGRKAESSKADVQLPCRGRLASREHIVIDVVGSPSAGYVHQVSLYKERVNKVLVGSGVLEWGDVLVIGNGDSLTIPDEPSGIDLRLVINEE